MPTWPFVHPWIAASAAVLAAVPIVIHILNRRRYRRIRWAAMDWLQAAQRKSARRVRIEQLLLLAIRALVMILIALAVARPLLSPAAAGIGQASRHLVIVLDDSYSMGMADDDGETVFARAKQAARDLLESLGRDDAVSLILASHPAQALIEAPSYDREATMQALARCERSDAATDLPGALRLAERLLAESDLPPSNRVAYVLTDGTATAWTEPTRTGEGTVKDIAKRVADAANLVIVDLGPEARSNLAVTSLELAAPVLSAEWPVTLLAEVANHARTALRDARLQIALNGEVLRAVPLPEVPPGSTKQARLSLALPEAGHHRIEVRLTGAAEDVLPLDDVRRLALTVRARTPALLVDGRPAADRFAGHTGYLATALAPRTGPTDPVLIRPRIVTPSELPSEPLEEYAAVALCNVRQLGPSGWERIERYVRGGGGVLITMGDQISTEDYNRFGFADGRGVLPARINGFAGEADDHEQFVRIQAEDLIHPIVAEFAGQPRSGLFLARFRRHARLVPEEAEDASTVLRFDNADPALVVGGLGEGRVAMAAFTANMDWTNLPGKGDYVSLVLNTFAWLVGDPTTARNVLVGQPLTGVLPSDAAALTAQFVGPKGERLQAVATSRPGQEEATMLRCERTDRSGFYQLSAGTRTLGFSANLDPAEGDLRAIRQEELTERLDFEFDYQTDPDAMLATSPSGLQREVGSLLFWIVLGLLAVETLLATWFGHHRE